VFFKRKGVSGNKEKGASGTKDNAGAQAENRAEAWLLQQGLVKRAKNYRCKLGEIDLIMMHDDTLVFIEVRLRSHRQFANAAESVTINKQQKIIKTAQYFLQEHQLTDKVNCRFDVIAFSDNGDPDWIKNAFSAF
jgi:putative endonuclease